MEFAFGKTTHYCPGRDKGPGFALYSLFRPTNHRSFSVPCSPTKLSSMLSISKSLNSHLLPWVYGSINFAFGCQGMTNFLWLIGPHNRSLINSMTLIFGRPALAHCVRWLSPDPVYDLFDPKSHVRPRALQGFWRCTIRDLARDLQLNVLTIDVDDIPPEDMPLVVGSLRHFFGSIACIQYTRGGVPLCANDKALSRLDPTQTWGQICRDVFLKHQGDTERVTPMGHGRQASLVADLEQAMSASSTAGFFTSVIG